MTFTVIVTYDKESGTFSASVPALPGCHTWGRTRREAFKNALEAIEVNVEGLRKLGEPIPVEVARKVAVF